MKTRKKKRVPVQAPWVDQVRWIRERSDAGWSDTRIAKTIRLPLSSIEGAKTWSPPDR